MLLINKTVTVVQHVCCTTVNFTFTSYDFKQAFQNMYGKKCAIKKKKGKNKCIQGLIYLLLQQTNQDFPFPYCLPPTIANFS
jgi:hypothetical protein